MFEPNVQSHRGRTNVQNKRKAVIFYLFFFALNSVLFGHNNFNNVSHDKLYVTSSIKEKQLRAYLYISRLGGRSHNVCYLFVFICLFYTERWRFFLSTFYLMFIKEFRSGFKLT